jgi:hypothetical protein
MRASLLITIFFSLAIFCYNYEFIIGAYTKSSFKIKSENLARAYKALRDKILKSSEIGKAELFPVAVYSKAVKGASYKIITAFKDHVNKSINLQESKIVIHSAVLEPTVSKIVNYDQNNFFLNEEKSNHINDEIQNSLKIRNGSLLEIVTVDSHPNIVYNDGFYVVEAKINIEGVISDEFFVVAEEKNHNDDKVPERNQLKDFNYEIVLNIPGFQ